MNLERIDEIIAKNITITDKRLYEGVFNAVLEAVNEENEACAKVCEEKQTYSMPIPCPDGIDGCCVAHFVPARREKTGTECAAAIRARGET